MFFGSLTLGASAISFNKRFLEYDWIQEPLESLEMVIQCDLIHVYIYVYIHIQIGVNRIYVPNYNQKINDIHGGMPIKPFS